MSLKSSISLKSKVSSLKSANARRARKQASHSTGRTSDFRLQTLDSAPAARPFVFVNMAMTADGKIATANRAVSSFGSQRDHEHLLELRATADAVMSGARTVDSAKINLGPGGEKYQRLRLKRGLAEYNLRIIVSGNGSINPAAEIFKHQFSPILVLTTRSAADQVGKSLLHVADVISSGDSEINFAAIFWWLRTEHGVKRLLCEGGGDLNDTLFRAGLVDELHLTVCPKIFGGRTAPTIAEGQGFATLPGTANFSLKSARRVGDEMFLVYGRAG
jgi:2,5-diamino-6-(ribosylamino)-4(3H)-pyrimidinone 5'-phosphate reductase